MKITHLIFITDIFRPRIECTGLFGGTLCLCEFSCFLLKFFTDHAAAARCRVSPCLGPVLSCTCCFEGPVTQTMPSSDNGGPISRGFEVVEGASKALPGRRKQKKPGLNVMTRPRVLMVANWPSFFGLICIHWTLIGPFIRGKIRRELSV